ncbi:MAG: class I SAM-dependent methyltransferase [Desulfamplus sp.]|nr:class I SAM-dependent methyltransferase [Desulfamplus sp.]
MNMELDFIKEMFDSIASRYDFLNRFLSMGQDVVWRREMVKAAALAGQGCKVLDVACGTCDVAIEVCRQTGSGATIAATDFSPGMLAIGKAKVDDLEADALKADALIDAPLRHGCREKPSKINLSKTRLSKIHLVAGNALYLPFPGALFDAVFIAFGIRNIMDRKGALRSFHGVLKKGGRLVVLELTSPPRGFFKDIYMLYFQRILPAVGAFFSRNSRAYSYLPASVLKFPPPGEFAAMMKECGFSQVRWKGMTFGIVTLFVGSRIT